MTSELDGQQQQQLIISHTGRCDVSSLIRCIEACGFDSTAYIANHEDLRQANLTPVQALPHFLSFGWRENRLLVTSAFPAGLAALFQLQIENNSYKNRVLSAVFLGGVTASGMTERVWAGDVSGTVSNLLAAQAKPFIVIGDSHAAHYARTFIRERHWHAPIVLTCAAGSASGLANNASRSQYGARILSWARGMAASEQKLDLPLLLKFGQVDAEFVWYFRRLRDGIKKFSVHQFTLFAAQSVRHYAGFLRQLMEITGPNMLRICSIFPPALSDAALAKGYVNEHIGVLEGDRGFDDLRSGVRSLETPNLHTRTQLHAIYNGLLEDACLELGVIFLDDFSPFLDGTGVIGEQYISESMGRNHHIDYNQTYDVIIDRISELCRVP